MQHDGRVPHGAVMGAVGVLSIIPLLQLLNRRLFGAALGLVSALPNDTDGSTALAMTRGGVKPDCYAERK